MKWAYFVSIFLELIYSMRNDQASYFYIILWYHHAYLFATNGKWKA